MSSFTPATQSTYPQAYAAAYQTPYAHYPPQARYASGNYPPTQSPTASYPLYQPSPAGGAPRADHEPAPQDLSNVDPAVASRSLDKLISFELKNEGFDAAEPAALRKLEAEVVAFIEELHKSAHEYANLANRTAPLAKDALEAVEEVGIELEDLRLVVELSGLRRQKMTGTLAHPPILLPALSRPPPPNLLSSDDEDSTPAVPSTLRTIPSYLPALPPKHTYLRTPPSPPKKQALPSLEKKLKNAGLVQESLKNLLLATEDVVGPDDGELLGAIVNWEGTAHPRKRWKVTTH